ncbi:MAG: hypothetical protein HY762_01875 [Planctomycetes bacterium]|nr:hypothetical protein [Planctomycetota bacterium]
MKTIMFVFLLSVIMVSGAEKASVSPPAPKEQVDIFKGLKRGDRVKIILNNGNAFAGEIKVILKTKIEIDVTYDDPALSGTISFQKRDIKQIEVLSALEPAEKKSVTEQKKKAIKSITSTSSSSEPEETEPPTETISEAEKEERELLSLLDKFPPGEVWSKKRLEEIKDANPLSRTAEEKEFLDVYEKWLKAQELVARKNRRELLTKFPPGADWNEDKFKDLSTRFVRLGVSLSKDEQEFVDKYSDWLKARVELEEEERKKKEQEAKEKETKETPPSPTPPSEAHPVRDTEK